MNPANLTRCEVCQYHYRLAAETMPWKVHLIVYGLAFLQIFAFFAIALTVGQVIRATGIVDEVYWGKVTFLKPETARGFLFMGVCFNCFAIGLATTIYLIVGLATGRFRRRTSDARREGEWSQTARGKRRRSNDCCRDCCYSDVWETSCYAWCYLNGPNCYCSPCEFGCASCDGECTQCCDCKGCWGGGCGCGDGAGDCGAVALAIFIVVALALVVLGLLVLFWSVLANVFYGLWLNQSITRNLVARRYHVLNYVPTSEPPDKAAEPVEAPNNAPQQEVMPERPNRVKHDQLDEDHQDGSPLPHSVEDPRIPPNPKDVDDMA
eukprot:g801.t1